MNPASLGIYAWSWNDSEETACGAGAGGGFPKEGFKICTFGIPQSQLNPTTQQEVKPLSNHAAPVPLHSLFLHLSLQSSWAQLPPIPKPQPDPPSFRGDPVPALPSLPTLPGTPAQPSSPLFTLQTPQYQPNPPKQGEKSFLGSKQQIQPHHPPGKMRLHLSAPQTEGSAAPLPLLPWQFGDGGDPLSPRIFPGSPKDNRTQPFNAGAAPGPPPWGWNPPNPA